VKTLSVASVWIHNTFGVFAYAFFAYLPVMAGTNLLSAFLINCVTRYFQSWSEWFKNIEENGQQNCQNSIK
jgi:hypothetical protein